MDRKRNSKGQFLPGNHVGRTFTEDNAREYASRGGIAAREARRARKALADTLREELAKPASERGTMTKQEYIVAKCLETLAKGKVFPKDLKVLAEVMGELKMNVNVGGEGGLLIRFDDGDGDTAE